MNAWVNFSQFILCNTVLCLLVPQGWLVVSGIPASHFMVTCEGAGSCSSHLGLPCKCTEGWDNSKLLYYLGISSFWSCVDRLLIWRSVPVWHRLFFCLFTVKCLISQCNVYFVQYWGIYWIVLNFAWSIFRLTRFKLLWVHIKIFTVLTLSSLLPETIQVLDFNLSVNLAALIYTDRRAAAAAGVATIPLTCELWRVCQMSVWTMHCRGKICCVNKMKQLSYFLPEEEAAWWREASWNLPEISCCPSAGWAGPTDLSGLSSGVKRIRSSRIL